RSRFPRHREQAARPRPARQAVRHLPPTSSAGIDAGPDERLRLENQTAVGLEPGHACGDFISDSATLGVAELQVELAQPRAPSLDPAPVLVEGLERDLARLPRDGDVPEARGGKDMLETTGICQRRRRIEHGSLVREVPAERIGKHAKEWDSVWH